MVRLNGDCLNNGNLPCLDILSILSEAPLGDFKNHIDGSVYTKRKRAHYEKNFEKYRVILKKKLKTIPAAINIYFMDLNNTVVPYQLIRKSQNIDYYFELKMPQIKKYFGEEVAAKISTGPQEISIIGFNAPDQSDPTFKPSAWNLLHDVLHGITLSSTKESRLLDKIDQSVARIERWADPIIPHKIRTNRQYDIRNEIATMGSARIKYFTLRGEEFTTELFTQYVFTGDVTFKVPDWVTNEKHRQNLQAELDKLRVFSVGVFKQILQLAKGRIFFSTF